MFQQNFHPGHNTPLFTVSDLNFLKYQYSKKAMPGDNPKATHHPDSDLLNKTEAYEMADYINSALKTWYGDHQWSKANALVIGRYLERLIKDHLPKEHRSNKEIRTWICQNYNKFR